MKKKFLFLPIAVILIICLSACKSKQTPFETVNEINNLINQSKSFDTQIDLQISNSGSSDDKDTLNLNGNAQINYPESKILFSGDFTSTIVLPIEFYYDKSNTLLLVMGQSISLPTNQSTVNSIASVLLLQTSNVDENLVTVTQINDNTYNVEYKIDKTNELVSSIAPEGTNFTFDQLNIKYILENDTIKTIQCNGTLNFNGTKKDILYVQNINQIDSKQEITPPSTSSSQNFFQQFLQ